MNIQQALVFLTNNPLYAISETKSRDNFYTEIRMDYDSNKKPRFRKLLKGKLIDINKKAIRIRNEKFYKLIKTGWIPKNFVKRTLCVLQNSKTGVNGVTLTYSWNKDRTISYPAWRSQWTNSKGKFKSKNFSFSKFDSPEIAFYEAVSCRLNKDIAKFSKSLINPIHYNKYWEKASKLI